MKRLLRNIIRSVEDFFFKPASARPLAALRIGLAAVLLAQAYFLRDNVFDFFGSSALVQADLAKKLSESFSPQISWFSHYFAAIGANETQQIYFLCWAYVFSLVFLLLGFRTRMSALFAFLLNWLLNNSSSTSSYGFDLYAHVFLFYLLWVPCGDLWSIDALLRRKAKLPSVPARLGLRLIQLHLCITYFFSGLDKAQGPQWWNGELIWRALTLPVYKQFDLYWIAQWPFLAKLACWSTLFLELGYCVFIWPRATRWIWIIAMLGLHLGIAFFLGLDIFGIAMCVFTLSAFGFSSEEDFGFRFKTLSVFGEELIL